jgi:hypothetical protein
MVSLGVYLLPSRGWRVRVYSAFLFVALDYIATAIFCRDYSQEANFVLRALMVFFDSVTLGLLAFSLSFYFPMYVVMSYASNVEPGANKSVILGLLSEYGRPLYDVVIGIFVASRHFEGAMSWFLPLSNRLWLALGFAVYLSVVHTGTLIERFKE